MYNPPLLHRFSAAAGSISSFSLIQVLRFALLLVASASLVGVSRAGGEVSITKVPFTISKSGSYVLRKSVTLTVESPAAIMVEADDVSLDLGDAVLTCNTARQTGVLATGKRFTLRNGVIRGFTVGVSFLGEAARITGLSVEDAVHGLEIGGSSSIIEHCTLRNIRPDATALQSIGILAVAFPMGSAVVRDNTIIGLSGQEAIGIAANGIIERNLVLNPSLVPSSVGISSPESRAYVGNNRIVSFGLGVRFQSGGGTYRDNVTMSCTTSYDGGTDLGNNQ
jgi:hypothetical protein